MSIPAYIQKTLVMKPEVTKIFDDLEAWHDQCRFELIDFNPADLYKSKAYRDWIYYSGRKNRPRDGERRPYLGNKPRYNNGERFSN